MDVRYSPEQLALRDAAVQVVERLGPRTVAGLDDVERAAKLDAAVSASGWRDLRTATEGGGPWASAVEVALVAEELGRTLADAAYAGPTLAAELRRLAGAPAAGARETVLLGPGLDVAPVAEGGPVPDGSLAFDAAGAASALALCGTAGGYALVEAVLPEDLADVGADLTRPVRRCPPLQAAIVPGQRRRLDADDVDRWRALGLAIGCADLVGVMGGALGLATEYARERRQYGAPIGSFQAVQHLLADALVATEGSRSVALHAAWAVDALSPGEALVAASIAKAYCARAARSVCETAIQVHGGIGNTWECLAHVHLRRALVSTDLLGGVGDALGRVLGAHGIGDDGLR